MEIPRSQTRSLLEEAGATRISGDAVDALAEAVEEAGLEVAEEAERQTSSEDRVTVTSEDVRMAAGRIAVHDTDSPLPPSVVPEDVVERHFHLTHDDLDEVIKEYWRGE